jgi:ABC-2 type transport system permease protein
MSRILSIFKKDITQILRNRFVAVISFLVIFVWALFYYLMPAKVDEVFKLGFYLRVNAEVAQKLSMTISREEIEKRLTEAGGEESEGGLEIVWANSLDELKKLVEKNNVSAGVSFNLTKDQPDVVLYVSSKTPVEVTEAGEIVAREIGYTLIGYQIPADFEETVVGPDMVGKQIPLRDRLRVTLISFVFILELYGLGNLLVEEVQKKTALAVLATPVNLREFIAAKTITSVLMAFSQGLLAALILQAFSQETWLALLLFIFLGSFMMVGLAFIVGSVSSDFMSMVMISLIPFIILMFPAVVIMDPGLNSPILKVIPTYYLIEPINGVVNYHFPLSDYYVSALYLSLFTVGFFVFGYFVLRRRLL